VQNVGLNIISLSQSTRLEVRGDIVNYVSFNIGLR